MDSDGAPLPPKASNGASTSEHGYSSSLAPHQQGSSSSAPQQQKGSSPMRCSGCNCQLADLTSLHGHLRSGVCVAERFPCTFFRGTAKCNKVFSSGKWLSSHIGNIHQSVAADLMETQIRTQTPPRSFARDPAPKLQALAPKPSTYSTSHSFAPNVTTYGMGRPQVTGLAPPKGKTLGGRRQDSGFDALMEEIDPYIEDVEEVEGEGDPLADPLGGVSPPRDSDGAPALGAVILG